ncbi:MAG: aspartate kinase [Myxococcales bacterium]|nr:aspartate kinase [Myxococcales bacterium]
MSVVVHKYGGSSVASIEKIRQVAHRVVATRQSGHNVVVVVSAMGNTTNELLALAKQVSMDPTVRELDMLLSVGERISMALLSMAINSLGYEAVSFTGSQSGIITNSSHARARIIEVRPFRIQDELDAGKIVIVAGYQGVSYRREITTLGRGGSDLTAIALAAALEAEYCEICSDVDGVFTADPRIVPDAKKIDVMSHDDMLEMARAGAKVLNSDAVLFAKQHGIAIYAKTTFGDETNTGTVVRRDSPRDAPAVTAVAGKKDYLLARLSCTSAGEAVAAYRKLLEAIGPNDPGPASTRMETGNTPGVSMLFPLENAPSVTELITRMRGAEKQLVLSEDFGTASAIGPYLGAFPALHVKALNAIGELESAPLWAESTASRLMFVVPTTHVDKAVQLLHTALISDLSK